MRCHTATYGAVREEEKGKITGNRNEKKERKDVQIIVTPRDRSGHFAHTAYEYKHVHVHAVKNGAFI
jgi:hypothetical protein